MIATATYSPSGGFFREFNLVGQHPAEVNADLKEVMVMFNQRQSPLRLTRTWGRHVPCRSKDDWDWKKSHNSGKAEENTRTPSVPAFLFS